jgi:hypothetical protein
MATQIPRPLAMNRRQLLATVAAIPMSGILPQVTADAVPVPSIPRSEPSPLNVCAATARRIEEITARNRIRAEACLPLLSIPKELRRMKTVHDAAEFEAFADVHRGAVWAEVLATKRETRGEPNWRPSDWMQGMAVQAQVSSALRQRLLAMGEAGLTGCLPAPNPCRTSGISQNVTAAPLNAWGRNRCDCGPMD